MKMTKIIALLLSVFMIVTMFAACGVDDTTTDDDIEETTPDTEPEKDPKEVLKEAIVANPQQAIADAMVLALAESAPEGMAGENKAIKIDFEMSDTENAIIASLAFDPTTMTAALDAKYDVDGEKLEGSAYIKGAEIAVKSDLLTEYLGYDCVGVDLDITKDTIVNSNLYKALPELLGVTEAELTELMDTVDIDAVITAVKTYITGVKDLYATAYVASAPVEEKTMINGTEVECFVVTYTIKENLVDDLVGLTVKLIEDLSAVIEETEYTEEDLKQMVESLSDSMPDTSGETKYYVSVATGALVKVEGNAKMSVTDEYGDTYDTNETFDITFGADPTTDFSPAFKFEMNDGYSTTTLTGETTKADGKTTLSGELTSTYSFGEESEPEVETNKYSFTLNSDNTFEFKLVDAWDDEYSFNGTLEISGNTVTVGLDPEVFGEDGPDVAKVTVTFGAAVPEMPEYKSIFDFTAEDIAAFVPAE